MNTKRINPDVMPIRMHYLLRRLKRLNKRRMRLIGKRSTELGVDKNLKQTIVVMHFLKQVLSKSRVFNMRRWPK